MTSKFIDTTNQRGYYNSYGYHAARMANADGRAPTPGTGDYHQAYHREGLIAQSREFMRDNGIYRGMVDRAVGYIVGGGFELQVTTKDPEYNKKVEKLWKDYWKKPETRGLLSGRLVQKMLCREVIVAGDTAAMKIDTGLLQLIEAEQIAGPFKIAKNGIQTDDYGKIKNFYITPYSQRGRVDKYKATAYPPEVVSYLANIDRPSETRGVPACQSVFPMMHRLNDICDSEAASWQLLSRLAVSIGKENAEADAYKLSTDDPNKTNTDTTGDAATRVTQLDYALIFHGAPGDSIRGIDRNIPGKDFSASVTMFLRLLGLPLGLPLEIILLDWTKSNYSQARSVLLQTYLSVFLDWQSLLEESFFEDIFSWKLKEWTQKGLLPQQDDIVKHEWIKPSFPWIDQLKEAQAHKLKVGLCFETQNQVCKSQNKDRESVVDVRELEIRDSIERAKKIKGETGVDVDWRLFAGLDTSDGQIVVNNQTGNTDNE